MKVEKVVPAFYGKPELKQEALREVAEHQRLDLLQQELYWDGDTQKGCSIGCMSRALPEAEVVEQTDRHKWVAEHYGIQEALTHLNDALFEALPTKEAKEFHANFWAAIVPGTDLSVVFWRFALAQFVDPTYGYSKLAELDNEPAVKEASDKIGVLICRHLAGEDVTDAEMDAAEDEFEKAVDGARAWAWAWSRAWGWALARAWARAWARARARARARAEEKFGENVYAFWQRDLLMACLAEAPMAEESKV